MVSQNLNIVIFLVFFFDQSNSKKWTEIFHPIGLTTGTVLVLLFDSTENWVLFIFGPDCLSRQARSIFDNFLQKYKVKIYPFTQKIN